MGIMEKKMETTRVSIELRAQGHDSTNSLLGVYLELCYF